MSSVKQITTDRRSKNEMKANEKAMKETHKRDVINLIDEWLNDDDEFSLEENPNEMASRIVNNDFVDLL